MEITVAIDDIHPEVGWGMPDDKCMGYLEELNKEFGVKFTLFIPSNYHNKFPISQHKDWIDWLKSKDYFELAAHGHYHQCERTDIGECEFFELDTKEKTKQRISLMLKEWGSVEHKPLGWRNPGWLAHPEAIKVIGKYFKYAAIHEQHNNGIPWECKTFIGHDGIHQADSIQLYNQDTFMFQSHIAGKTNDNNWTEENYENFRNVLLFLQEEYDLEYKTLGELV